MAKSLSKHKKVGNSSVLDMTVNDPVTQLVTQRIVEAGARYWAGDNVSEYIKDGEQEKLIDELAAKFESVLDSLLIDRKNDPNSMETGQRMAKMYYTELFEGRYTPKPKVTAFPNSNPQDRYAGLLITRAEVKSMCSHHHQPVTGTCWIGLLPTTHVIGLSKYARIAQWHARRGTLQEELTKRIADAIMEETKTEDVGIIISAVHGCCTNRGVMAHDSTTVTSVLHGQFYNPSVKEEFHRLVANYKVMASL